jgi:hypothetical protein
MMSRIVVLKDGAIVEIGTYLELLKNETSYFKEFLGSFHQSMLSEENNNESSVSLDDSDRLPTSPKATSPRHGQSPTKDAKKGVEDESKVLQSFVSDEYTNRETGKVDIKVYFEWAKAAGGTWVIMPMLVVFAFGQGITVLANWWLTYWSHAATPDDQSQMHFLRIYGIISGSAVVADFLRMAIVVLLGLQAARTLFAKMLDSILRAPMSFFDTTPTGRLINRFSKGKRKHHRRDEQHLIPPVPIFTVPCRYLHPRGVASRFHDNVLFLCLRRAEHSFRRDVCNTHLRCHVTAHPLFLSAAASLFHSILQRVEKARFHQSITDLFSVW